MSILHKLFSNYSPIERVTEALAICDINHAQVHDGNAFSFNPFLNLVDFQNANPIWFTMEIPENIYVHLQNISFSFNKDVLFELIEGDGIDNMGEWGWGFPS